MTERLQVYKCGVCGNMVEVLHTGVGTLTCCEHAMNLRRENTTDAATEKHVPVVEHRDATTAVTVGEVPHPMQEDHYIEWVELIVDGRVLRTYLKPGDAPAAVFNISEEGVVAREYCNLHGLWRKD